MSLVPTILYPNGGESILGSEVTIRWQALTSIDGKTTYELYYTDNYRPNEEPDWKQIASLPDSSTNYLWRFGKALKSDRCRVAIRARSQDGERSEFNISADNFSIRRKKLSTPSVITPIAKERYDKYVEIVTDNSGIIGTHSQRSYYQFYYSSVKSGISPTPIAQNILVGADPVFWDTSNLVPADDYVLQVFLSDDEGNVSESVFVRNIQIAHDGFFIVDTTPPVASIVVNNNDAFTNKREVSVNIVSYDEATGVHSMYLTDGNEDGKPDAIADVKRFVLSDDNEVKSVQLQLQDYGANRYNDSATIQRLFEVIVEIENTEMVDLTLDRDTKTLWAITDGDGKYLYSVTDFPSRKITFSASPTSVIFYKSSVWVALNVLNKGVFQRFDGSKMVSVKLFSEADSVVNAMEVHNGYLFIGLENGIIYRFDGLNFDIIDELDSPVKFMYSDGNLLYLSLKNNLKVHIYNGTTFFSTGD